MELENVVVARGSDRTPWADDQAASPTEIAATAPGEFKVIRRNGKVTTFDGSKIKVAITKNELHAVPKDVALLPGMSASAEIKVGSRRLITFFFYPIIRTLDSGLRDP